MHPRPLVVLLLVQGASCSLAMSVQNEAFRRALPCTLDALHLRLLEILDGTFQFEHVFRVGLATCQNSRILSVHLFVSSLFVYFDHILWSMD